MYSYPKYFFLNKLEKYVKAEKDNERVRALPALETSSIQCVLSMIIRTYVTLNIFLYFLLPVLKAWTNCTLHFLSSASQSIMYQIWWFGNTHLPQESI